MSDIRIMEHSLASLRGRGAQLMSYSVVIRRPGKPWFELVFDTRTKMRREARRLRKLDAQALNALCDS